MPGDELFKRYLEIGASVLGMSRDRAETIVKDLVASGEVARGQATKAADWLVERGRAGTQELAELVRREVRQQVASLGLATKADVERLEAQLAGARAPATPSVTAAPPAPAAATATATPAAGAPRAVRTVRKTPVAGAKAAGTRAAGGTKAAGGTGTSKPVAKKPLASTPAAGRPAGAGGTDAGGADTGGADTGGADTGGGSATSGAAGITRSGSVRRRPSRSGSTKPDPASPAGGALPPKG